MKVLAAAAAAVVAIIVVATSAGGQAPQGRTITLIEQPKGSTFGFVDNPPKTRRTKQGEPVRFSAGDIEAFSSRVTDQQGNPQGRVDAHCIVSRPGGPRTEEDSCLGAFTLRDGTIALATATRGEQTKITIAVVGGTGAYNGARGTMTSVYSPKTGRSTDTIELLP
jgi:hypothetical protein